MGNKSSYSKLSINNVNLNNTSDNISSTYYKKCMELSTCPNTFYEDNKILELKPFHAEFLTRLAYEGPVIRVERLPNRYYISKGWLTKYEFTLELGDKAYVQVLKKHETHESILDMVYRDKSPPIGW